MSFPLWINFVPDTVVATAHTAYTVVATNIGILIFLLQHLHTNSFKL